MQLLTHLNLWPRISTYAHGSHKDGEGNAWSVIIGIVIVLGLAAVWIWLTILQRRGEKMKGIFPSDFPFTRRNLMIAYTRTATTLARKDSTTFLASKMAFINGYLLREFADVYGDEYDLEYSFRDGYTWSLSHPVSIKTTGEWLNKHLGTREEREQLIHFLVDVALYDGVANTSELQSVQLFAIYLALDENIVKDRVGSNVTIIDETEKALDVLGLTKGSSDSLIGLAYGKLLNLYHSDNFTETSPEVRQKAAAKFREIQKAYEYLMS